MDNNIFQKIKKYIQYDRLIIDAILLSIVWILLILLVNPVGDFPLNDDWVFTKFVKIFIEQHYIKLSDGIYMTLISNILWGGLFSSIFGFSYFSLRISSLVVSLIAIITFYIILRKLGIKRPLSYLLTCVLIFNPVFFSLSFTFMTDNFFLAFVLLSFLCFINYLKTKSIAQIVLATVFSVIALMSRQVGLFLPLSFFIVLLIYDDSKFKKIFLAALPLLISVVVLIIFYLYFKSTGNIPKSYGSYSNSMYDTLIKPLRLIKFLTSYSLMTILDIGLFLLPLLPLFIYYFFKSNRILLKKIIIITIIISIPQIVLLCLNSNLLPFFHNNIQKGGIGPLNIYFIYKLDKSYYTELPKSFWLCLTLLSRFNGTFLLSALIVLIKMNFPNFRRSQYSLKNIITLFSILSILIYWSIFCLSSVYDRYFLIILPFIIVAIFLLIDIIKISFVAMALSICCLIFLGYFSISGTIDYLGINQTKWNIINDLTKNDKISTDNINGGYEINGTYGFSKDFKIDSLKGGNLWDGDLEYIMALGTKKGYDVYRTYTFKRHLPECTDRIFILKRKVN